MKIHVIKTVDGNFGDELNSWMWTALLPNRWDDDGDTLFVGIGTILDKNLPPARHIVVFGAGAGYTGAPPGISTDSARWQVYGVRGPLTARALQLDQSLAMTDPAILLATLPEFRGLARQGVIFVPHWKSVRYGYWEQVCKSVGIEFLDPCADSKSVVRRIASAEKVIAESMHAAIIADAFRVAWIPVALSREISPFKWVDWAQSLQVPYSPICLPASNHIERLRNFLLQWSVHCNAVKYPSAATVDRGYQMRCDDLTQLMADFDAAGQRMRQHWRVNASTGLEVILKRLARFSLSRSHLGASKRLQESATHHLQRLRAHAGYLSSDAAHGRALDLTQTRLGDFDTASQRQGLAPVRAGG